MYGIHIDTASKLSIVTICFRVIIPICVYRRAERVCVLHQYTSQLRQTPPRRVYCERVAVV